jgi:hypothetical protein
MTTTTAARAATPAGLDARVLGRLLDEGFGPGSWHGPDLRAALADVGPDTAFQRPAPGRHSIAEIALHHAYFVRAVRGQLTGAEPEPFVLEGADWFALPDGRALSWDRIRTTVEAEQAALAKVADAIARGRVRSPLGDAERFDLVLGITCHAVYHAGQVQLVKRLLSDR